MSHSDYQFSTLTDMNRKCSIATLLTYQAGFRKTMDVNPRPSQVPTLDRGHGTPLPASGTHPLAERDVLYRDNLEHRQHPRKLRQDDIDTSTPVSVLGLEQITISRLYRAGYVRLRQLLDTSVEDLWRSIGRHGITDILRQLELQGLALQPLNDYERWRLGLIDRSGIQVDITLDSQVADLWPKLGLALTELLQKRGLHRIADLAPRDEAELLILYRLGKSNLRKIHDVLEDLSHRANGQHLARLRYAMQLIAARSEGRRSETCADSSDRNRTNPTGDMPRKASASGPGFGEQDADR